MNTSLSLKFGFFFALLLVFSGCTGGEGSFFSSSEVARLSSTEMTRTNSFSQTAAPEKGEEIAILKTSHGEMKIRFFPEQAPKAVENFITHSKNGYYDGIAFHRVIENFMIQGGDPLGNGTGGESIWKTDFEDEFSPDLSNIRGSLAMANRGPATNGSQFFINQAANGNPYLDNRHTVFGQVFEGLDVLDSIAQVETNSMDKPLDDIVMDIDIVKY